MKVNVGTRPDAWGRSKRHLELHTFVLEKHKDRKNNLTCQVFQSATFVLQTVQTQPPTRPTGFLLCLDISWNGINQRPD